MSELQPRSRENNNNSHLWNRNDHGKYRKCKLFSSLADYFLFAKKMGKKENFQGKQAEERKTD